MRLIIAQVSETIRTFFDKFQEIVENHEENKALEYGSE
jgi:hypothetical protein